MPQPTSAAPAGLVMDESHSINDDLRLCGLPGDDQDDLAADGEALFGSSCAPTNVDGDAGAGGIGVGASRSLTPTSTPTASMGTSVCAKHVRSAA